MVKKDNIKRKNIQKSIAKNRINKLFIMAEQSACQGRLNLASRYVEIARKISMKYLVPIPYEYKRCFCKHCYSYLLPSVNSTFRINKGKIIIFCKNCKKYTRLPFKNKSKK